MCKVDPRGCRVAHHIFDRVLVAERVRALDRVVHVPGPVIRRVVAKACCDAALRRDGMAARREDLCDAGCSQALFGTAHGGAQRSEEHTSELQSLMRISYAVFCLKTKKKHNNNRHTPSRTYKQTTTQ